MMKSYALELSCTIKEILRRQRDLQRAIKAIIATMKTIIVLLETISAQLWKVPSMHSWILV